MLCGYHGRYLRIDLSSRTWQPVPLDEELYRQSIGGVGLGTQLLRRETPACLDALEGAAPLLFVFSPLVGSPLTTSAKFAILAKSPLTHRINDSLSSSHFAIAGKKSGYDAMCIVGRSSTPCVVRVTPDSVEFESAEELWGHSAATTSKILRVRWGAKFRVAAIGPAGERLVRYATISNDGRHAGRGGLGAVMGSKNLKAIAVTGDRLTHPAHPERLLTYAKELSRTSFGPATEKYRELGTVSNLLTFNRLGMLPTRNFQETTFADAQRLDPATMGTARTRASCAACTIGCEHLFERRDGVQSPVRLEYENLYSLGPLCGVSDPDTVLAASAYCDEAGIDTISAGASIAFGMECAERGLIDEPDLRFGNGASLLAMLEKIANRVDLGELLGEGVRIAAEQIGGGSDAFAPHVKGLEIPGYDPRALQTMALGFAVGTRGADHNRSGAYQVDLSEHVDRLHPSDDAVRRAIETEDEAAIMDSLILCKFLRGVFEDRFAAMAEMLELVTGIEDSGETLRTKSRAIVTSKKRYNIDQGWTPKEDCLPERFFTEELAGSPSAGGLLDSDRLQEMIRTYNRKRGWSDEGYPLPEV